MDRIPIIDTHEHLHFPHQLEAIERFDFGRLFSHYLNSDVCSAGREYLAKALETVPLSKIHGFGGDFFFVEG